MIDINRRDFMQLAAGTAAMGFVVPSLQAQASGPKVKVGVIGCGGRGQFIMGLMAQHGGYEFVCVDDYFEDRVKAAGDKHNIPQAKRHTGLDGWKRVLDDDVQAVVCTQTPYFRPEHATAAIEAGKHAYLAKPVAVDVPGCKSIESAGHMATRGKQVMLVDFQTRVNEFYTQAFKRLQAGDMGDVTFIDAKYHGGQLRQRAEENGSVENRLRNWVFDIALSGDIITEQFIHSLDVASWAMGREPRSASAMCGRKVRTQVGDCNDNFTALIQYDDGIGCTFSGKQYNDGASDEGITVNVLGTKGRMLTKYGGRVALYGKPFYKGGETGSIYRDGAAANVAEFHRRINAGEHDNPTIAPSVRSNLLTILVRTAAYTGEVITWKQLLADTKRLDGKLDGLKA